MFDYILALFIDILLKRILQENIIMTLFTTIISLILAEAIISGIYTVIGITDIYWIDNLTLRLLPTNICNTYNCINPIKDRKSTRLNSSHVAISYAVFCLKTNTEK